eukprot:2443807-Rhodomonas_salina.1
MRHPSHPTRALGAHHDCSDALPQGRVLRATNGSLKGGCVALSVGRVLGVGLCDASVSAAQQNKLLFWRSAVDTTSGTNCARNVPQMCLTDSGVVAVLCAALRERVVCGQPDKGADQLAEVCERISGGGRGLADGCQKRRIGMGEGGGGRGTERGYRPGADEGLAEMTTSLVSFIIASHTLPPYSVGYLARHSMPRQADVAHVRVRSTAVSGPLRTMIKVAPLVWCLGAGQGEREDSKRGGEGRGDEER